MSMLSAQIDELRGLAGDGGMEWVAGPVRASILRNAADTILSLRDRAQELQDENAKLRDDLEFERSENGWAREFLDRMAGHCGTKDCPNLVAYVEGLEDENAKLRELVRDYEHCSVHADCSRCEYDGKLSTHCPFSPCFPDIDELRELGVEVDG